MAYRSPSLPRAWMCPQSNSFRIPMICSSVNRFRFKRSSPWSFFRKTHSRSGPFYGGKVTPNCNVAAFSLQANVAVRAAGRARSEWLCRI